MQQFTVTHRGHHRHGRMQQFTVTHRGHHRHGRMQQFARIGLMALALSDSMFCLSILPHAWAERDPLSTSISFSVVYSAYGEAVFNTFAMIGTWLTVT